MVNIETNENQNKQIDCKLDSLQCRVDLINSENKFYSYEKDDDWNYFAKVNWVKLEVPFKKPEDLIKALETIKYMIYTYIKSWYNTKLYAQEDIGTKWDRYSIIDLKIDNRRTLPDTTFLTWETTQKVFWINDSRNKMLTQKIADFLNQVLETKKEAN